MVTFTTADFLLYLRPHSGGCYHVSLAIRRYDSWGYVVTRCPFLQYALGYPHLVICYNDVTVAVATYI